MSNDMFDENGYFSQLRKLESDESRKLAIDALGKFMDLQNGFAEQACSYKEKIGQLAEILEPGDENLLLLAAMHKYASAEVDYHETVGLCAVIFDAVSEHLTLASNNALFHLCINSAVTLGDAFSMMRGTLKAMDNIKTKEETTLIEELTALGQQFDDQAIIFAKAGEEYGQTMEFIVNDGNSIN